MGVAILHDVLRSFFRRYAGFVVRWSAALFVGPLVLTALLATGFLNHVPERHYNITAQYTPVDARSYREKLHFIRRWPMNRWDFTVEGAVPNSFHFLYVMFQAAGKDIVEEEENLMEPKYLDTLKKFESFLAENLTAELDGKAYTYADACIGWGRCYRSSDTVLPLLEMGGNGSLINGIPLTYPIFNPEMAPVDLSGSYGGVTLFPNGTVEAISAVKLWFFLDMAPERERISVAWLRKVEDTLEAEWRGDDTGHSVKGFWFGSRVIEFGMNDQVGTIVPQVSVTFVVLAVFATLATLRTGDGRGWGVDWRRSKASWALAGIATAFMGVASGVGLCPLLGFWYSQTSAVIPFLVVSIGVDDMFILTAAWHQSRHGVRRGRAEERLGARMAETMEEAAVAITITSVTDALSFAVGSISQIPTVQLFCRDAALAVVFNYIYQITFFASVMVFGGRREEEGRSLCCPDRSDGRVHGCPSKGSVSVHSAAASEGSASTAVIVHKEALSRKKSVPDHIRHSLRPILLSPLYRAAIALLYAVYIGGATYGVTELREGLDYRRLLLKGNNMNDMLPVDERFFASSVQAHLLVGQAPNMSRLANRRKIEEIVQRIERSPLIADGGTHFWLRSYESYLRTSSSSAAAAANPFGDVFGGGFVPTTTPSPREDVALTEDDDFWTGQLHEWSLSNANRQLFSRDFVWVPAPDSTEERPRVRLESFRLRLGLAAYKEPEAQRAVVHWLRDVVDQYPQYDLQVYGYHFELTDQFDEIKPNTIQNVLIGLACMVTISLLLIPSAVCTVFIALAIVSIDFGVFGYMCLWDVSLDAVSMITIIMSIGFAVDFAAHITFGFVSSDKDNSADAIVEGLERLGWPVVQGAVSTVLGIAVLGFVESYLIQVFFKTILMVIAFGALHALLFLPVLLVSLPKCLYTPKSRQT